MTNQYQEAPDWPSLLDSLNNHMKGFLNLSRLLSDPIIDDSDDIFPVIRNTHSALLDIQYALAFFAELPTQWVELTQPILDLLDDILSAKYISLEDEKKLRALIIQVKREWPQSYQKVLSPYIRKTSPGSKSFVWENLRIENPAGIREDNLWQALDALKEGLELLKRRGLEPLVVKTLKRIYIASREEFDNLGYGHAAGFYDSRTKTIYFKENQISYDHITDTSLIKRWFTEIFLHELGHHVHMNLLTPNAVKFWDAPWISMTDKWEVWNSLLEITYSDVKVFISQIEKSNWNLNSAYKSFQGIQKLQFRIWLHRLNWSASLRKIKATTLYAKLDPSALKSQALNTSLYPMELNEVEIAILEKDPDSPKQELNKALEAMGIPSAYGHENEQEDFAETFVLYVADPRLLSSTAFRRMSQTLYLSSLSGTPILKKKSNVGSRANRLNYPILSQSRR